LPKTKNVANVVVKLQVLKKVTEKELGRKHN
jgi:hypothetical protein